MSSNWSPEIWSDFILLREHVSYFVHNVHAIWVQDKFHQFQVPGSRQETRIRDAAVNHVQPVGAERAIFLKICFFGSSWSYMIMFEIMPQLCKKGNLFSAVCGQMLTIPCVWIEKLYRYHFVKNDSKIPCISYWVLAIMFFLKGELCRNSVWLFWGCWRGYPLQASLTVCHNIQRFLLSFCTADSQWQSFLRILVMLDTFTGRFAAASCYAFHVFAHQLATRQPKRS